MLKKKGLIGTIKNLKFVPFVFFGVLLFLSKDNILNLVCLFLEVSIRSSMFSLVRLLLYGFLAFIWIYSFFIFAREKLYYFHTKGRSYYCDHSTYKRGYFSLVNYFKNAEPHKMDLSEFPEKNWKETTGIIFGKDKKRLVYIPSNCESNVAAFGPPGTGKTTALAIINAMRFGGSVIAIDIKGDIYNFVHKHTKRKIVRFCPDSKNALQDSVHFNPFAGVNKMNETEKKLFFENMATVLIPDQGGNEGNYFESRARKMFQGIVMLVLSVQPDASFPDVVHMILTGNINGWIEIAKNSSCEAAQEQLLSFEGNSSKNITSAYDALTTALVHFSNPVLDELLSNKGGKFISVKTLEKGYDVYLQISQHNLTAYAPLFTLLLQTISMDLTRRPDSSTGAKNRPILMMLDEFPRLTFSYEMIDSILSTLRSKSVIVMLLQQNLSQIQKKYTSEGARSIIGNCNYQVILGSNDIESSKNFSQMFGSKKILKVGNSQNGENVGTSVQEATDRVYQPEEFGDLPSEGKLILYAKGKYAKLDKVYCYQ